MDSQTLKIKAQREQLFSTFFFRGLIGASKYLYFLAILLCAAFVLITCKQDSVYEGQNKFAFEACGSNGVGFSTSSPDICEHDTSSELVPKLSVQQHSLESICPSSNSLCFPSTLIGFNAEPESADTSIGFSSEPKLTKSNLSWSRNHSTFRLLDGRLVSCSLYQQDADGFHEFPPSDGNTKHDHKSDVSSCISPLVHDKTHILKPGQNTKSVTSGFLDGLSSPNVEIKPNLMDWGHKSIYNPSLAFSMVKNVDSSNVLTLYDLYSSNSQFYACNFSEIILVPGEVASICIVFFPTKFGISSSQLVLQTNFGGFLIMAKGFAVESPYLIKPLIGLDNYFEGRWRKNFSLFNPFDDALHVQEVTAWLSTSSGDTLLTSRAKCVTDTTEVSRKYSTLNVEDWLNDPEISMKPHENWEVGPQKTGNVMEFDVSYNFEGKIFGALCVKLSRSSNNEIDTVMVPLEAEIRPGSYSDTNSVSAYLDLLVPRDTSGSLVVALLVRNASPNVISVVNVRLIGETTHAFQVKYVEGLLLYPHSSSQVAILSYGHEDDSEVYLNCKLLIVVNDTRNTQIEIPCKDVVIFCSESQLHFSVGHIERFENVDLINGRQKAIGGKAVDTREADALILRSWKSQASTSRVSILDTKELLFQVIHVGTYSSQWIAVKNPSQKPVVMQLILNSGELIDKCKNPDSLLHPSSSNTLTGNKSIAPTRYGFSIAKNGLSEIFLHPYQSAFLGPILFQPSNRCEWTSSALVRNNLSGVEWLSLRGSGGSLSLVLLEGSDPVQNLQFKLNVQSQLNVSFSKGGKHPSCSEPLAKEVFAKNMGELPVVVARIKVSGSECGLDGFQVHGCRGFTLQPGESMKLRISYVSDFTVDTIQRDLELVLATGILLIPMKATLPIYVLNYCKRSFFWSRLKKVMLVLVFSAVMLYLLACLLLPRTTSLKSGETSFFSAIHSLDSLHMDFSLKMSHKVNGLEKLFGEEEELLLESATKSSDGKQTSSLLDSQPETRSISTVLSKSSSVENTKIQNVSDSQNLSVKVVKEKGRRRRKKQSGAGVLFDVSSSQSGNSTPSSPLSPFTSTVKRPWPISPGVERSIDIPFKHAPVQQQDGVKCSEPTSKVNILANQATSRRDYQYCGSSANEKTDVTRKIAGRAVLLPSATIPTSGRAFPARTCNSPVLASTSAIAPHARAPGTKICSPKTGEVGKTMVFEEKFTYDIWGDHLFGQSPTHKANEVSSNNSHSFFVTGPQSLGGSSLKSGKLNDALRLIGMSNDRHIQAEVVDDLHLLPGVFYGDHRICLPHKSWRRQLAVVENDFNMGFEDKRSQTHWWAGWYGLHMDGT